MNLIVPVLFRARREQSMSLKALPRSCLTCSSISVSLQYRRRKQMISHLPEAAPAMRQMQQVATGWDPKKNTPLLGNFFPISLPQHTHVPRKTNQINDSAGIRKVTCAETRIPVGGWIVGAKHSSSSERRRSKYTGRPLKKKGEDTSKHSRPHQPRSNNVEFACSAWLRGSARPDGV